MSARSRAVALSTLGVVMVALAGTGAALDHAPSPLQLMGFPLFMLVFIGAGLVPLRRSVFANALNRQAVGVIFLTLTLIVLGRSLGLVSDIAPAEHLTRDSFIAAGVFLTGGLTLLRWLTFLGAIYLFSGVACALWPDHAQTTFASTSAIVVLTSAAISWHGARARD